MELETFFSVSQQLRIFLLSCLGGAFIGVVYDVFRALRIAVPHGKIAVFAEDCIFFGICGLYLMLFALVFARGELRIYMVFGSLIGFVIYLLSVGKIVTGILLKIRGFLVALAKAVAKPFVIIAKYSAHKLCMYTKKLKKGENIDKPLDLPTESEV